jgi:nanoRNase/pAp phosphatase (c-di-AMP/oligoRNAs hydrolase)
MIYNYIIFHRGCIDGFSGFFVAHYSGKLHKESIIYPDVPSTKRIPKNIEGKNVLIIDVAYRKEILEEIVKVAKSVVFIDHHVSIKDDVAIIHKKYNEKNNITIVYDSAMSGCTLAWKFFFPRQKIPLFLKYIEDQDTGRWVFDNTKPFIFALKTFYHLSTENKSLNKWFRLLKKQTVFDLIEIGKNIQKFNDHLVGVNLPKHSLEKFPSKIIYDKAEDSEYKDLFSKIGQHKVAVYCGLNCPSITELSIRALDKIDCDFCIMWTLNLDKKEYVLSFRSKEVDVSKIAKLFGGGGHKLAAACSFKMKDYRIEDIFDGNSLPRTLKY